jgi:hypothetical protein
LIDGALAIPSVEKKKSQREIPVDTFLALERGKNHLNRPGQFLQAQRGGGVDLLESESGAAGAVPSTQRSHLEEK